MVRMTSSGARSPAWKSTECPIEPWLTSVTTKVSPTRPCSVGPGTVPLKVHRFCRTPGATSSSTSSIVSVTAWVRASPIGGRAAGAAVKPAPGAPDRSSGASSPDAVAAPGAVARPLAVVVAGPPLTTTSRTMPIWRCPTMRHQPWVLAPTTPTSRVADAAGHHPPGLGAAGEGEVVRRPVVEVDQVDDEAVAVGDADRGVGE